MSAVDGGVFGMAGGSGLGSMISADAGEGFEDLTGEPMMGQRPPPMMGQPIPGARMPMAQPRRGAMAYGMGQDTMLPATCSCSKVGPMMLGFLIGAVLTGAGIGAYCYFRR